MLTVEDKTKESMEEVAKIIADLIHVSIDWVRENVLMKTRKMYSPDGTLFCSISGNIIKVWYEARPLSWASIYLRHPAPVTSLEWRKTSTFANILMTSCKDNRIRIWVQTLVPDLVNFGLLPHFHLAAIIGDQVPDPIALWINSTEVLCKSNGTLNLWKVEYLDGDETGLFRQVVAKKMSCFESALPLHDATTKLSVITAGSEDPTVYLITQHLSGTLVLWKLDLERGIELVTKITGLPISPEWLQDGFLNLSYDSETGDLSTRWVTDEVESTEDSYRASQLSRNCKILPQYQPEQLVELLAFGKLQRVKAILNHVVNCLAPKESLNEGKRTHRSRTLSIVGQPSFHDSLDLDSPPIQQEIIEEIELDYLEVTSIKPLTLYSLLDADVEKPSSSDGKTHHAHEEFSSGYGSIMQSRSQVDETLDEILGKSTIETIIKQKEMQRLESEEQSKEPLTSFNPKKAKLLTRILTHTHLPGLTSVDQMHLLAVADAVALFDASPDDLSDLHEEEDPDGMSMVTTNIAIDALDDRGLRFLTAMRQYVYLTKCLPMKQRNDLKSTGIGSHNLVWAFHSETQDELVGLIPCVQRNKPDWSELREFGVGWWLRKLEVLRKLIEKVAQSAFQAKQDPLDAALFYLAMKKKTLVCALLRRTNCDKRLLKLFEQDFSDPVNRKKALKNAYALLGLHRFEHAAAFFILAGSIWDAVEVCINNLNDIQLAIVLIRLHDNDANIPDNLKRLLFTEILGSRRPTEQPQTPTSPVVDSPIATNRFEFSYDAKEAHKDAFLRSIAFWRLGDYVSAVQTLLEGDVSANCYNFYRFLKNQPLVMKHQFKEEDEFKNRVAQNYLDKGCPMLALEVSTLDKIKFLACLHILLNELNTLAHPGESNQKFDEWVERNIEALRQICSYTGSEEPILRTMLTYCSLHIASEESLNTVRLELLSKISSK